MGGGKSFHAINPIPDGCWKCREKIEHLENMLKDSRATVNLYKMIVAGHEQMTIRTERELHRLLALIKSINAKDKS